MASDVIVKLYLRFCAYFCDIFRLSKVTNGYIIHQPVSLVWVGGFPAHYMGEFHSLLQANYPSVTFIYTPLGLNGSAFEHEITNLPKYFFLVKKPFKLLSTWFHLWRISPKSILISGNFPRINLVAVIWAILNKREIYYLADSNVLDRQNLHRGCLNRIILGMLLNKVTKILSIGKRNTEFYLGYRDRNDLSNILVPFPLPHRNQLFESVKPNSKSIFTFLVFGRLEIIKGVDRIISAYSLLEPNLQIRSRLLIAGDGSARGLLEEQVKTLGLQDRIEFRGSIPSDETHFVYGESNALVIASHDEPWGLVVNEALSSCIPVIGPFWIGSFADLVVDGVTGLITTDNTPRQLADAMEKLLFSPADAKTMGKFGQALVRERGWTIEGSLQSFAKLPALSARSG